MTNDEIIAECMKSRAFTEATAKASKLFVGFPIDNNMRRILEETTGIIIRATVISGFILGRAYQMKNPQDQKL